MTEFTHPLIDELSVDPAAVLRTMAMVLELAEESGSDFAAVLFPTDPRRCGFVYGAIQPGSVLAEDVPDVRVLLAAGRWSLVRVIAGLKAAPAELEVWRGRAVAAEAEVARLRFALEHPALGGAAGVDGKVSGLRTTLERMVRSRAGESA